MKPANPYERDVMSLERDLDEGRITQAEFDRDMHVLTREYQREAEEESRRAEWDAEMRMDAFGG